jgi:hypothetical protein
MDFPTGRVAQRDKLTLGPQKSLPVLDRAAGESPFSFPQGHTLVSKVRPGSAIPPSLLPAVMGVRVFFPLCLSAGWLLQRNFVIGT